MSWIVFILFSGRKGVAGFRMLSVFSGYGTFKCAGQLLDVDVE